MRIYMANKAYGMNVNWRNIFMLNEMILPFCKINFFKIYHNNMELLKMKYWNNMAFF